MDKGDNNLKIAIIGAGTMGNGIAQVFATGGYEVVLVDVQENALANARAMIERSLQKLAKKISEVDVEGSLQRIHFTTDKTTVQNADLVIEAIIENVQEKQLLFKELDALCEDKTILASNTSSLTISDFAAVTKRPDRVCGMHFFNPVPIMELVELSATSETSEQTMSKVEQLVMSIQKKTVRVADKPLFIVNRLLVPLVSEAILLLEEGTATVEDIDKSMQLGAHHPIGPLWMADMIGLDTMLNIQKALYEKTRDAKYKVPTLLTTMVEAGELGRKTGKGFYTYE